MERYLTFAIVVVLTGLSAVLVPFDRWFAAAFIVFLALSLLGLYDVMQSRHSILRNYPVLGHMRFIFEGIRPEIRQYLIENEKDEEPFSREQRSLVYQRAKGVEDKRPFGAQIDPGDPDDMIRIRVRIRRSEVDGERKYEIVEVPACHWYESDLPGLEPAEAEAPAKD